MLEPVSVVAVLQELARVHEPEILLALEPELEQMHCNFEHGPAQQRGLESVLEADGLAQLRRSFMCWAHPAQYSTV